MAAVHRGPRSQVRGVCEAPAASLAPALCFPEAELQPDKLIAVVTQALPWLGAAQGGAGAGNARPQPEAELEPELHLHPRAQPHFPWPAPAGPPFMPSRAFVYGSRCWMI